MTRVSYDIARIRSRFPALAEGAAHFDGPGGTQVPIEVAEAVAKTLTSAVANRGPVTAAARRADEVVAANRAAMADLLGAEPAGIVYGRSATALTFDFARTLAHTWRPGDEIVVTRLDHDANVRPWVIAAERADVTVRFCDFDAESGDLTSDHLAECLGTRTRLVAFTAASNLIGSRPDVAALTSLAHAAGALVWVDAVHHVPHVRTDVAAAGADFWSCSPYKFLGPHCGAVAADPALLAELHPDKLLPSTQNVPERFELGTLPYELMAGVTAAVDFLADLVPGPGDRSERLDRSFAALVDHEEGLFATLLDGLTGMPHVRLITQPSSRTPTVLFEVTGLASAEVALRLAERGVNAPAGNFYAIETARHLGLGDAGAVRAGLAPYTDDEDVRRLLEAVAGLA